MAQRFCTRCGGPLEPGGRFCGRCGQAVREAAASDPDEPTMAADVPAESDQSEDDLLADWDFGLEDQDAAPPPAPAAPPTPLPPADEAPTQAIAVNPAPRDTAVLPVQPQQAPYEPDAGPPPGPAAAPAPRERAAGRGFPFGATFALLGAVAVIISSILDWGRGELIGTLPRDISARTLIDPGAEATGINMGIVLLVAGTVGALVALLTMAVPFLRFLRRLVGLLTLAVPVLFVIRVAIPLFIAGQFGFQDVVSVLGAGFYFAAGGALVQMIAGRWFGR